MTARTEVGTGRVVHRRSDLELYQRLLRGSRPYWPHMVVLFLLSLAAAPLALLAPVPLAIVVDNVIGAKPLGAPMSSLLPDWVTGSPNSLLLAAALMLVVLAVLGMAQQLSLHLLHTYTGEKLLLAFRSRLFRHVQRLSLGYHDSMGTSDSIYRIQYDAFAVQKVTLDGVIPLVSAVLTFGSMMWVTYLVSWQLCLVALAVTPVLLLLTKSYRPRLRRQSHEVKRVESTALSVVQEVLTGIRVVKAFGQEEREAERFMEHSGRGLRARLRLAVTESGFGSAVIMTTTIGLALTMLVGTALVLDGTITLGALLLVMGYVTQLYGPLKTASKRLAGMQEAFASADRAYALLDEAPDVEESPVAVAIGRASGLVEFRDVSFAYDGGRDVVLRGVSFTVTPGQRLGIAGATGAGKTTLVNLLSRFYDPTEGSIHLDGRDLREYRLADLRNQFGIVLQDPLLFSTSIAENISYARPGASMGEITEAASAAGAHDFIMGLPDGYETLVGERGMTLSGGERQRISLARAFLKDAPLLLLDEPTSSVDVQTEAAIMTAMDRLMEGRTTLMIAHRLNTLEHCDVVLQVQGGRVVGPPGPARSAPTSDPKVDPRPEGGRSTAPAVSTADGGC